MNRYDRLYKETEIKADRIEKINELLLKGSLLKNSICNREYNIFVLVAKNNSIINILLNFEGLKKEDKSFFIENVFPKLSKSCIITYYMQYLSIYLLRKDYKKIDILMKSFKDTKLINDIILSDNKDFFIITTKAGEKVPFNNCCVDIKAVKAFNGNCHYVTEFAMNQDNLDIERVVTIRHNNLFKSSILHTFPINSEGYILDFARNIIIKYDDLKKLIDYRTIINIDTECLKRNIDSLKNKDLDYSNSKKCNILKYA